MTSWSDEEFAGFLDRLRTSAPGRDDEPPPDPLVALTARDFSRLETPGITPLLGELLVRGKRHLIAAATGDGKSTMVMHMVRAVTTKGEFLDWTGAGGRVLVVDLEQTIDDIQRLLKETGLEDSDDVDVLHAPDGIDLTNAGEARMLEDLIAQGAYDLVVLDPAYKMHTGDSNAERDTMVLMKTLDAWRTTHGFALLIPMHCRKQPPQVKFSMNEIFGSTTWLRGAEVILGLQLIGDGVSRLHFWKSRSGGLPQRTHWDLSFTRDGGYHKRAGIGGDELAQTVVDTIQQAMPRGATMPELTKATGKGRDAVKRILERLGLDGRHYPGEKMKRYRLERAGDDELKVWEELADG